MITSPKCSPDAYDRCLLLPPRMRKGCGCEWTKIIGTLWIELSRFVLPFFREAPNPTGQTG